MRDTKSKNLSVKSYSSTTGEAEPHNDVKNKSIKGNDDSNLPVVLLESRHKERISGTDYEALLQGWRLKERMKTVSVALVLCLNVGTDPPDVVKTQPCARLECWTDPLAMSPQKALESIGANLQKQYERWQPRARYKQSLDPTVEEVKKLATSLRRNAKDERVLFHYNGHGVPKPTVNGELWVFNRSYTQYIPLSIYDLQSWMWSPSIYVFDCSNAGIILDAFKLFAEQHEREYEQLMMQSRGTLPAQMTPAPSFRHCIQLGACNTVQTLPMSPDLPADLFTSCLTTPIRVALRWFVLQNTSRLVPCITLELLDKIPGQLNDRRTMLGELNWVFTAITDTIAWNCLPRELFQRLFRQDLLVASLFRNFLLAERVMRSFECTPVSSPKLPPTYQHPMWQAWDLALDVCLSQLPGILTHSNAFVHSPFFEEQLTAFEVWLSHGSKERSPPEQLPIVLQVLLSQVHRLRALELLGRFLDLGPWAVNLALSVGIFPYVLKLLQSSAKELRPLLVFIWAKILAVDVSCQADLVRDGGHKYFLSVLQESGVPLDQRILAAFVLTRIVWNHLPGQEAALQGALLSHALELLADNFVHMDQRSDESDLLKEPSPPLQSGWLLGQSKRLQDPALLRQWLLLALGGAWEGYEAARWSGVRDSAHEKLYAYLEDPVPEVRASAVYALGTYIASVRQRSEHANHIDQSISLKLVGMATNEASSLVRCELLRALQWALLAFQTNVVQLCQQYAEEERVREMHASLGPQHHTITEGMLGTPVKRVASRDVLRAFGSPAQPLHTLGTSPELDGMHTSPSSGSLDKLRRATSSNSLATVGLSNPTPSLSMSSLFGRLWTCILLLEKDPHPSVSQLAHILADYIRNKTKEQYGAKEDTRWQTSFSSSGEGDRLNFSASESPPGGLSMTVTPRSSRTKKKSFSTPAKISEENEETPQIPAQPLITTGYVEWCCTKFAHPFIETVDLEDNPDTAYQKQWRYNRNLRVREEAREEQRRTKMLSPSWSNARLDEQLFVNRNNETPSLVAFHAYDPILAATDKQRCTLWDWERGFRMGSILNSPARLTALQWLNPQDESLLLLGTDDGCVRIWKDFLAPCSVSTSFVTVDKDGIEPVVLQPALVSAFHALPELSPSTRGSGLVLNWEQSTQHLLACGDVRFLRIWDLATEKKVADMGSGAEACVTCVDVHKYRPGYVCAGFGDGSVRIYDKRARPSHSRVRTWRDQATWIVGLGWRSCDENSLIAGSVSGEVKVYDLRGAGVVATYQVGQGMTAMAMHTEVDVFACGTLNQHVGIYTGSGEPVNVLKWQDSFMGQRSAAVSCLAFHPHKLCLVGGSVDTCLAVYGHYSSVSGLAHHKLGIGSVNSIPLLTSHCELFDQYAEDNYLG